MLHNAERTCVGGKVEITSEVSGEVGRVSVGSVSGSFGVGGIPVEGVSAECLEDPGLGSSVFTGAEAGFLY